MRHATAWLLAATLTVVLSSCGTNNITDSFITPAATAPVQTATATKASMATATAMPATATPMSVPTPTATAQVQAVVDLRAVHMI